MFKIVILPEANQDIIDAAKWYKSQQSDPGKRFTRQVRKQLTTIRKNPESAAVRYDNTRTTVLEIFPYLIHYDVNVAEQTIFVFAVLHTSRSPNLWTRHQS